MLSGPLAPLVQRRVCARALCLCKRGEGADDHDAPDASCTPQRVNHAAQNTLPVDLDQGFYVGSGLLRERTLDAPSGGQYHIKTLMSRHACIVCMCGIHACLMLPARPPIFLPAFQP